MRTAPAVLHLLASDERRGAESFGVLLAQELAARGWRSDVRAVRSTRSPERHAVDVLGDDWHDLRGLKAFRGLARDYDVVVAHGSSTLWTAGLALPRRPPFVYVNIGDPLFWSSTPARRLRVGALLRRAAAVAAISPAAAETLRSHLRVPVDRLHVVPNARSTSRFAPVEPLEKRRLRGLLDLGPAVPAVAYVGSLSTEKRPDLAVRTVALVPEAHLVMAGDGPLRTEMERLGEELMPGRLNLRGNVARPEDVLAACDILLLTSATEGVPGVLIEAGLTGLPCVTTDVGYAADVVLDGRTGRVVPSAQAPELADAVRETLSASSWGAAAREHCVATFGLGHVVDLWEELLEGVVRESVPGGQTA